MHKRILSFTLFVISACSINAQQRLSTTAVTTSIAPTNPKFHYATNPNETARAIEFNSQRITTSDFLANINSYFNIPAEFYFIETESSNDNLGMRHRMVQQFYKGIPLEGMVYRVHEKNGFVTAANGKAVRHVILDTNTLLSEQQAFQMAVNYLETRDTVFRSGKKLIVSKGFTFTPQSFSVAFQFDIDVSLIERWRVSIDGRTGQLLNKVSLVNSCLTDLTPPPTYDTGVGLTNYYGNKTIRVEKLGAGSRLVGKTENGGNIGTYDYRSASVLAFLFGFNVPVYDFYSADNTYFNPYQKPAISVQWAAEQAYEYYFTKHNRNSFDNKGSAIISYVHVDRDMNNAFWARNRMLFGNGSNNNPLVELDVVGHELTHGVTQFEAQLQYYKEPGALNESFSDIFAKAIEFSTFGDTATWQLAKYYRSGGLRDLSNPNLKNQPDTYLGDMWFTGYEDNGGVHYNSGVQNFWFYLLCEGGSGVNDHGISYSIKSIGMDTVAKIAYRNLSEYLGYFSDYLDSRIGSLLATADLYGKNSLAYQEVDKAWDAVGVIDEPIIQSLEIYDITATTVKLKGSLEPRGEHVTYHFEYGTTPTFGSSSSIYNYTDKVDGVVRGLQSETEYYLRLVATNENGSSYSSVIKFTTLSLTPLVKIKHTVDITESSAILYGRVNPNSLLTSYYFEYGLTPLLGMVTPTIVLSDDTELLNVSASIANLQSRQTYYYRLVATNDFASAITETVRFFTAVKPVISSFTPVTATPEAEVTIYGQYFNPISEKNLVSFGATQGIVLSSSVTEIKVRVPAGASLGPISLLDVESGLSATSVQEFVPTFNGDFKKGNFQLRAAFNDMAYHRLLVHDMDGDSKPDLVASHNTGFSVFQNVNTGGDITNESFVRSTYPTASYFEFLALADFDGNGRMDVIGRYGNGLRIYPNFSVPGFIFFDVPVDLPIGFWRNMEFKDFDMDGHIDLAGIGPQLPGDSSMFTIFRNQSPKEILLGHNFEKQYEKAIHYFVYSSSTSDLNNDGTPDLLSTSYDNFALSIFKNASHPGAFKFEETILQDSSRKRFAEYIAYDLNQDGWKDIISRSPISYEMVGLRVFENKGTSPTINLAKPIIALSSHSESIRPSDINGDGIVDLVVGDYDARFIYIQNKTEAGQHFSESSFQLFERYGINQNSSNVRSDIIVNDLNGDGRPDVINKLSYGFYPYKGNQLEIWQNSPNNCTDPSQVTLNVSKNSVTFILPPNTTLDQFEIEYAPLSANYWLSSTYLTITGLHSGASYKLRIRARCYLGFTDYYLKTFTTECVDLSSFKIVTIGTNSIMLNANDLSSFEVQYSLSGKNQWTTLYQYSNQIVGLLPGTTYDLRFRGRCSGLPEFNYMQFTTLCPILSTLTISDVSYNKARVNWTSTHASNAILEYSADNINWTLIDETQTMLLLTPGQKYFVRGRSVCENNYSDFSITSFTTLCPKVSMLTVTSITPFSAGLSWVDESATDNYSVTYSIVAGGPPTTITISSSTSIFLDRLIPGTLYNITVAPHCIGAKDFTAITFTTLCYSPFDLSVGAITYTTAELAWDDQFNGQSYYIDYSIFGSNKWLTKQTDGKTIELDRLRPGTKYEARVHINCSSVTAPYASLLFETNLYGETSFAPNPTDREITIFPSKNVIGNSFSIYDNAGRSAVHGKLFDYTIDLAGFPPGIYILKIEGEKPMKIVMR